jgi:hypothetical protein
MGQTADYLPLSQHTVQAHIPSVSGAVHNKTVDRKAIYLTQLPVGTERQ